MFQSISWHEFLTVALIGGIGYYAVSSVVLYSEEIKSFFRNGRINLPGSDNTTDQIQNLIGAAKPEPRAEWEPGSGDLQFAPLKKQEESVSPSNDPDMLLVGSVADLVEEIKTLSKKTSTVSKEAISSRFKPLLLRYPQLSSTKYRETISLLISDTLKEHSPHSISHQEVDSWWISSTEKSITSK